MTTKERTGSALAFLREEFGELTFGRALRAARLGQELTQAELGERLGVTPARISDMENDRKGVSAELAMRTADALGMSGRVFARLALQDQLRNSGGDWVVVLEDPHKKAS